MAKPAILCLLATLSLFSGCLGAETPVGPTGPGPGADLPASMGPEEASVVDAAAAPSVTAQVATEIPFSLLVGLGTPVSGTNAPSPVGPLRGGPFKVGDQATLLVIDADWTCLSGALCKLALVLYDDDGEVAAVVDATDAAHVELAEPDSGEWGVAMFASMEGSAAVQAEGTIHVTVTRVTTA